MKETETPNISKNEVEHIALLAHINLTEEEKSVFTEQLGAILRFFSEIDKVNTKNIKPTYHVLDLVNVYRKDKEEKSLPKKSVLENASKKEDGFFKSPRMI